MRAQNAGKNDPLESLFQRASEAAAAYESRWTLSALERVNPELHEALIDQRSLWHESFVTHAPDTVIHGEAMIRGWQAATRAMEEAGAQDDAYMIGRDVFNGRIVAIGDQRAAIHRVRELYGQETVWLSPDEVAKMLAGMDLLAKVKAAWPASDIVEFRAREYPDEPAQGDGDEA